MNGPFDCAGLRWWLPEGAVPDDALRRIAAAEAALAAGAPPLKHGRRKSGYRLALPGEDTGFLLKVNRYPVGRGEARRRVSKARRELARAERIHARGIATPLPVAAGERVTDGRIEACHLLVALLPGANDLRQHLAHDAGSPAERRRLAEAFGRFAREIHEAGLVQDDFQPNNFLVRMSPGGDPELWAIDFERARVLPFGRSVPRRARLRALAKLERELHGVPASQQMRFLRAYAGGERATARALSHRLARAVVRLARRDLAHLRRSARPGRRFAPLPGGAGLARPGLAPARLEPGEGTRIVPLSRPGARHARTQLARALLLAARGLAPVPRAVVWEPPSPRLVFAAGPRSSALVDPAARRVLARRLARYGRLLRPLEERDLDWAVDGTGRGIARLVATEAWDVRPRFGGRGGSAGPAR